MLFLILFLIGFILSVVFTFLIRRLAIKWRILDYAGVIERKIHREATPLLGGTAIFIVFFIVLFIIYFNPWNLIPELGGFIRKIPIKHLAGIFIAGLFLMVGGFLDDKYNVKPQKQIIWPILACLAVIASGIGIEFINNPLREGYLYFDKVKIEIIRLNGIPYYFTPLADIITFIWLMVLMYATKLLDGLDGLVSGMTVIGSLTIAGLCFLTRFYQPDIGIMALILAGAGLGFLVFNFHPAKIFLGEGGSLFAGFILGILAIISGGKLATTFLILGLAIIDLISVVIQRIFIEHRSPFSGDQKHLHFRLLNIGFSHRGTAIFYWLVAVFFGFISLFARTTGKVIALFFLIALASCLIVFFSFRQFGFKKTVEKK